jgi:alanine-synthesizing transaminase
MLSRRSHVDDRPNRLAIALAERRRAGRATLDLTVSNPTRAGIPYDEEGILRAIATPRALEYEPEALGLPVARDAVARLWERRGLTVPPSRVALTASTSEAYSFLFKLLCDPGDAVLVPEPSYPLFEHLARYDAVDVIAYPLEYDGAWHVDVARLAQRRSPRTRAVVTVSPNNPTGSYLKKDELAAIAAMGLPIVSDEVFGEYPLSDDARRARSALEAEGALVFALDGLSKLAALPQLKLAWITVGGPAALVEEALSRLTLLCDTFLSPGAPVQHALPSLLESAERSRRAILRRASANRDALVSLARGTAVTPLAIEGGWYAVLRLPAVLSEEAWVLGLLEQRDVLVQPGWFYDFRSEPFVVASLLTPEPDFAEGLARLVDHVARET